MGREPISGTIAPNKYRPNTEPPAAQRAMQGEHFSYASVLSMFSIGVRSFRPCFDHLAVHSCVANKNPRNGHHRCVGAPSGAHGGAFRGQAGGWGGAQTEFGNAFKAAVISHRLRSEERIVKRTQIYCSQAVTKSGVAQWLACWAHNPKVRGSKPRSAIILMHGRRARAQAGRRAKRV